MYRKFTADYIFNGYELLNAPAVLITSGSGEIIDMVKTPDAGDGIEIFNGLLTPGFINAHCHLELSHLRGIIPEKTGLVEFVQQVMSKRVSPGELKTTAMQEAADEMYKTGVTAVGDICNTTDSILLKRTSALLWHNFIEVSGFTDLAAQKRFDEMKKVYEQFSNKNSNHTSTLSPHAPYSVSKKLFQLLNIETARQLITIHNQESAAENDLYKDKNGDFLTLYKNFGIDISSFEPTGKSSLQSWLPFFTNSQSIICVHNTFTSEADLQFIESRAANSDHGFFYCLCVNANRYIEQKIAPVGLLIKNHCDIILGTDSLASNHQLNIFEEIKTIMAETGNVVPLSQVLKWATINGARALQLDHLTGSFEKGKKPGIVLIEGLKDLEPVKHSLARRIL